MDKISVFFFIEEEVSEEIKVFRLSTVTIYFLYFEWVKVNSKLNKVTIPNVSAVQVPFQGNGGREFWK